MGPLVVSLVLAVAPTAEARPIDGVLSARAEQAEIRTFLRQAYAAYNLVAWIDAVNAPPPASVARTDEEVSTDAPVRAVTNDSGGCDGRTFAIPTRIVARESGCSYTARNPNSSAGGAYQMIQSTANGAARAIGHPELVGVNAADWPPELQDQAAAHLWNGGAGCGHWAPTNGCGG